MTYDERISTSVPLSKILDVFIEDNEDPSIILNFINSYNFDTVKDTLRYSSCSDRLFQIDYINRFSTSDLSSFVCLLRKISWEFNMCDLYLYWQSLQSNLPQNKKEIIKETIIQEHDVQKELHPYHGRTGTKMKLYDSVFMDCTRTFDEVMYDINRMKDDVFMDYMKNIDSSLWKYRILQLDFLISLEPQKQYIMMREICHSRGNNVHIQFFKQVLKSDVHTGIKRMIYDAITPYEINGFISAIPDEMKRIVDDARSYGEIMIKTQLMGFEEFIDNIIFYILCQKKTNLLRSMYEYSQEDLKKYFDIRDLLRNVLNV